LAKKRNKKRPPRAPNHLNLRLLDTSLINFSNDFAQLVDSPHNHCFFFD